MNIDERLFRGMHPKYMWNCAVFPILQIEKNTVNTLAAVSHETTGPM